MMPDALKITLKLGVSPMRTCLLVAFSFCLTASNLMAADWGDLKVRFVLDGDVPAPAKLDAKSNKEFCGKFDLVDETLVANKENKGIKNIYLFAYTSGRDSIELPAVHPDLKDAKSKTHILQNKNCRFEPRALLLRVGDKLKVTNPDTVGHNAHLYFIENEEVNLLIPAGKDETFEVEAPERAPTNVTCDIHDWMKAKVHVLDHPYGAISDKDGVATIKNLPAGTKLAFRVIHEKARLAGTEVAGEELSRRSTFEYEVKAGMNDLGEVKIPVAKFE